MYAKLRLFLAQVLALAALVIVIHTWAAILSPILHIPHIPTQPLWPMLVAGVVALGFVRLTASRSRWERLTLLQVFALLSAYTTAQIGTQPPSITVFTFAIYAVCLLVPSLHDTAWEYTEIRQWLTLVSLLMGLALVVAVFVGRLPVVGALFGFAFSAVLSLGFAWERHVEATSSHGPTHRRAAWMLSAAGVFFVAVAAAGHGLFSMRPLFALIAGWGRDVFSLLLFPVGYMVTALVMFLHFLQRLFPVGERTPAEEEGLGEPLAARARMMAEANPIFLQILVVVFGIFLLGLLYAALARRGSLGAATTDEREAIEVEFKLPKLRWSRKRTKPRLLTRPPKDIWEAFLYLEQWGKSRLRPRRQAETAAEYSDALQLILPRDELITVASAFESARYGEQDLTPHEWQLALAAWERMSQKDRGVSQRDGGARHPLENRPTR